jgi:hypothetical protein
MARAAEDYSDVKGVGADETFTKRGPDENFVTFVFHLDKRKLLTDNRMRSYTDARARQMFRDLIDLAATIKVMPSQIHVTFHRRAHLPIVLASGLSTETPRVP